MKNIKVDEDMTDHKIFHHMLPLRIILIMLCLGWMTFYLMSADTKVAFGIEVEGKEFGISINPENELFKINNMAPGDKVSQPLVIKNSGKRGFTYDLSAVMDKGEMLFSILQLKVQDKDNQTLYNGKLKNLKDSSLGILGPSNEETLNFTLSFPSEAGNEYQGETTSVTFLFKATEQINENTNDADNYIPPSRLGGSDRIETAILVSQNGWPEGAPAVVLSRDDDFADALAGAPLAMKVNAPILLTNKQYLTPRTLAEIERLRPQKIYILGLHGAVSEDIEQTLKDKGNNVVRLGGLDRFGTAEQIARFIGVHERVAIVNGYQFADALSISPWAALENVPILFAESDFIPDVTQSIIKDFGVEQSLVIGGTGVVGEKVASELPGVTRFAGQNRYATNVDILSQLGKGVSPLFLATGEDFPDALTSSVLAAKNKAMILLIDKDLSDPAVIDYVKRNRGSVVISKIIGGPGAISQAVVDKIHLLNGR